MKQLRDKDKVQRLSDYTQDIRDSKYLVIHEDYLKLSDAYCPTATERLFSMKAEYGFPSAHDTCGRYGWDAAMKYIHDQLNNKC